MSKNPLYSGRPFFLGVAIALFPHISPADTGKFYDDGLTQPSMAYEHSTIGIARPKDAGSKVADTARFYDEGLTSAYATPQIMEIHNEILPLTIGRFEIPKI